MASLKTPAPFEEGMETIARPLSVDRQGRRKTPEGHEGLHKL